MFVFALPSSLSWRAYLSVPLTLVFWLQVVHPRGVSLRKLPSMTAERSVNIMEYGEVFVACERQWVREEVVGCTGTYVMHGRNRMAI